MRHDQLHRNKLSRHLCPLGAQKPSETRRAPSPAHAGRAGGRWGAGGWASAQMAKHSEWSSVISPVPTFCSLTAPPHDCLLYTTGICHSGFVCFLKFCANDFIPGAPLSHGHVLLFSFSWATYKFLKIRNFNGSADSAWTLLYQHRVRWKDKIKGLYKLQLCVPDDFL